MGLEDPDPHPCFQNGGPCVGDGGPRRLLRDLHCQGYITLKQKYIQTKKKTKKMRLKGFIKHQWGWRGVARTLKKN